MRKSSKLSLSRETLRHLEETGLRELAGGVKNTITNCPQSCGTCITSTEPDCIVSRG